MLLVLPVLLVLVLFVAVNILEAEAKAAADVGCSRLMCMPPCKLPVLPRLPVDELLLPMLPLLMADGETSGADARDALDELADGREDAEAAAELAES